MRHWTAPAHLAVLFLLVSLVACGNVTMEADAGDQTPDGQTAVDAPIDANLCEPLLSCGDRCVDPANDDEYCGARGDCAGENRGVHCGVDTPPGDSCESGVCVGERQLIVNGTFETDLSGWLTANNPANPGTTPAHDPNVVFMWVEPGFANAGTSMGPAARQLYQDFTVPTQLAAAIFTSVHYQQGATGDLDPENVFAIEKDPVDAAGGGAQNAYRVDIVAPAGELFYEPILFTLFLPDAVPIASPDVPEPIEISSPELLDFLRGHEGQALRLRIGHVESTFPWQSGIDDISLLVIGH